MKILAIIVTFNGMRWVDTCLGSLRSSSLALDAFVLDNGSTDGTPDYIRTHFPEVHLVESAENLGFARGNNAGLRYALEQGYDFVYLLNQDAWILPDTLGKLVRAAEETPRAGVVSPVQKAADGRLDVQFSKRVPRGEGVVEVPFVMAAHWLITRQCLETVGLFAPIFPFYGEDDNFCGRARYHGFKVLVCMDAEAVHDRAGREETLEKIIWRNYRMASLVKLCDLSRPLALQRACVLLYTVVKSCRYRSSLPWEHYRELRSMLPEIRQMRALFRGTGSFL